jgi:hypothetical protein
MGLVCCAVKHEIKWRNLCPLARMRMRIGGRQVGLSTLTTFSLSLSLPGPAHNLINGTEVKTQNLT